MKMKNKFLVILLLIVILSIPSLGSADMGMIPFPRDVHLDESGQNAIVAWNGSEEVLILSTDVKSSEPATVLRILTLPSNPITVEEGDFDSFTKITEIINTKAKDIRSGVPELGGFGGEVRSPGIKITFQKKIGAHDITIVKVNDLDYFINWIKDFSNEGGFEYSEISQEFRNGVSDCINRGITYFVFDVIKTGENEESVKPLVYRFKSDFLYYPLEITAISDVGSSYGDVNVFLITKGVVNEDAVSNINLWPRAGFRYSIELSKHELKEISPELEDMFESNPFLMNAYYKGSPEPHPFLMKAHYMGPLSRLNEDLVVYQHDIHIPTLVDRISQSISVFLSPFLAFKFVSWSLKMLPGAASDPTIVFVPIALLSFIVGIPSVIYIIARMIKRLLKNRGLESSGYNLASYAIAIIVTVFLLLSSDFRLAISAILIFIIVGFSMMVFPIMNFLDKHIF